MSDRFRNKYRIPSARWQQWDYGSNGAYYVTICTAGKQHFFGAVRGGVVHLTDTGRMADMFWQEIPRHFPFVLLDAFVIMPNHMHGILVIDKTATQSIDGWVDVDVETRQCLVSTGATDNTLPALHTTPGQQRFRNPGKHTLSSIIGAYKSAVTKNARSILPDFGWQSRFHDRVIRDERAFDAIRNYIRNNPGNWGRDPFNT